MRIIAGAWRGRAIEAPAGTGTRPTSDRAREGLFSMLTSRLGTFEDLKVADLFAGTGSYGLEALSRGAAGCTFVENDRNAIDALRRNVAKLDAGDRADVRAQDATRIAGGPFDLVFLDPPYGSGLGETAIAQLVASKALAAGCLVALETGRGEHATIAGLAELANRTYGKARIRILRKGVEDRG